ncbi:MAG TPA: alpha-amylase family glycosyl hydrolase [Gemmatimonadales bacterium]|nr:alpha-amylase family glycosyl hydrolase [Gemmatimonadales bacterium]
MHTRNCVAAIAVLLPLAAGCAPSRPAAARVTAPDTSWVARSAIYEVNVRDFSPTGDLPGVTRGLDRIAAVGANVVWLMPIYPVGILNAKGPLGSPYAVRDFLAIDSAFGTAADLRELVGAAHARGMKVILDWVPDHTSWDNVWMRQHPDYYIRDERGQPIVPRDKQGKPTDWTDVAQLDYGNPELRRAMIAAMRHWLEQFDLDGFRVDVAGFVPDAFWREAVPALRAAAPRPILLLAEWGDLEMHRLGFDLTYGWDSYSRLKAVWRGAPADTFVRSELTDLSAMPPGGMRLRFTTNHDETAWDKPPVTLFDGAAGARAAFVAMALLPGRPLIYDGQEVESPQQLGLFRRDSIVWAQHDTIGTRSFYRRVLDLAQTDSAFLTGPLEQVETSAPKDVIAYRRGAVLVLANARSRPVRVVVTGFAVTGARDLLSDRTLAGDTIALQAYSAVVLKRSP